MTVHFNHKILSMQIRIFFFAFLLSVSVKAQIAPDYEVATWYQFKTAAVTYTFDDLTGRQLSVALPLFDQYNYKVTFYPVINWSPNWTGLQNASNNGHEVGSHTLSHPGLNTLTVENQDAELKQSQSTINNKITNALCVTISYPYCNLGDMASVQKYYIAGRICSGVIEPYTPNDFYRISSIAVGSETSVKTAADLNNKVNSAKSSKGWCTFLIHGIDTDGGYSPIQSTELASHLMFMNTNYAGFWIGTFANVAKYVKERNAITLTEIAITPDSLKLIAGDNLSDSIYNVPVTLKRLLPSGWPGTKVYSKSKLINSSISVVGDKKYVIFDVIPDQGEIYLAKANSSNTSVRKLNHIQEIKVGANPFYDKTKIRMEGDFRYSIFSLYGELVENGTGNSIANVGTNLSKGIFILKIITAEQTTSSKINKL